MDFFKVEPRLVKRGDFFVVRYIPTYQDKGIVATEVTEIYDGGFEYQNLSMGVRGSFDDEMIAEMKREGLVVDELLVGLSQGFSPSLTGDLVHRVGGIYIPKNQKELLVQLSDNKFYQRSLQGLENPDKIMGQKELEEILRH